MSLRRHIPELAIDWVLDEPDKLWRVIPGSLCFADISGFTALAERLALRGRSGGEELVETLSRVFAVMIDITHDHGGMLLKFGGDALLLFFDGDDHTRRAAGAAVEMRRALRKAAEIPTSVGPLRLSMSVGVHSGDVHFFLVGSTHKELIVLGPSASAVVDVEHAANAGEIVLSAGAAAMLPAHAVKPRADGQRLLRWRRSPVAPRRRRRREASDELIASLFPRQLGAFLAAPPEPEHRVACIAFIRFSGTDALLREQGADALASALQSTVGTVQRCLEDEGVTLLAIDIDGDGGKFFLGAGVPFAHEDDEGVMLRALRRINDANLPLPLQTGVNRGHVFAAEVGARDRAAYSAMGDTTNTAARIASKAPAGLLYAHPSVLDQSLTLFEVRPAGPFTFKGKKVPMLVYDVGREIGPRRREGLQVDAFVGRPNELALLRDAIASCEAGRGAVLSIVGDSGIGKSRLLREAVDALPQERVVALRAEPYGANASFKLLREPLRELLGTEGVDAQTSAALLLQVVSRSAPDLVPWLSLIGDALQIDVEPSAQVIALQPGFRAERRALALIALIAAHRPGPLTFVVDDAQWTDEASSELLSHVARACRERAWLMLVARRDTETGFRPGPDIELSIGPLPDVESRRLVELATEAAPLRAHDVDEVVRRSGGNPLFAMEILRTAREVGSLDAVPLSLEATLAAQIDALDVNARRLLRFASVLGRSFARAVLEDLVRSQDNTTSLDALARLDEFLEANGSELRFRNGLVRDTTYESVAFRLRTKLHALAGETIERGSADAADNADALALHFSRAGDASRTWRYARHAAQRARKTYANIDATRYYEMALAAAKRLPALDRDEHVKTWTELGDTRELAGLFADSLDAYRRALRLAGDDPIVRADLLFGRARAKERAGEFSSALRDLSIGLRDVQHATAPEAAGARARLRSFAAMVLFGQDRPRKALAEARHAVDEARRCGEQVSLGRALIVLDLARTALEGPGSGEHLQEALRIFETIGDIRMQANVRANLGFLNAHACRWDEAISWLQSGRELDLRTGDSVGGAYAGLNIGEILVNQRRFDEAQALLQEARRAMRAAEFDEGVAIIDIQLARIAIERGQPAQAEASMAATAAEFARLQKHAFALEATIVLAEALLARSRASDALVLIERAALAAGQDAQLARPKTARVRARALAALGRTMDVDEELAAGLDVARRHGLRYDEALLLATRAELAGSANGISKAEETEDALSALQIFESLGVRGTPRLRGVTEG
jgi:class 3 adenylate cyclase/tetratricopeptide (TPR) repeat protein